MSLHEITEHVIEIDGHTTFYRASGPDRGTPIVFVHGWPELSLSWRHQLSALGSLGFRCIAPDMRGYGRSSVYPRHADYAIECIVGDLLALADALELERAIWVGHDWGSPMVWSMVSHHPERCHGVASLCLPYRTLELGLDSLIDLVDRDRYPEATFPAGQWEYMRYYEEHFDEACAAFDRNPYNLVRLLFRKGDPAGFGLPAATAFTRINDGWFGDLGEAPALPLDEDVVSEAELTEYATHLETNGFFGPDSYYVNRELNAAYAMSAVNGGLLEMPALFLAAQYDYVCDAITSDLAVPMREFCRDLTEQVVYSGHWMTQERPLDVNSALTRWLAAKFPDLWWSSAPS